MAISDTEKAVVLLANRIATRTVFIIGGIENVISLIKNTEDWKDFGEEGAAIYSELFSTNPFAKEAGARELITWVVSAKTIAKHWYDTDEVPKIIDLNGATCNLAFDFKIVKATKSAWFAHLGKACCPFYILEAVAESDFGTISVNDNGLLVLEPYPVGMEKTA